MLRVYGRKTGKSLATKDQFDLFAAPQTLPPSAPAVRKPAEPPAAKSRPLRIEAAGIDHRLVDFVMGTQRKRGRPPKSLKAVPPNVDEGKRLLDVREAAARLGLSKSTLDKMRCSGRGPRFIRATDRAIRYDPVDLQAFADERRQQSTSQIIASLNA